MLFNNTMYENISISTISLSNLLNDDLVIENLLNHRNVIIIYKILYYLSKNIYNTLKQICKSVFLNIHFF